MSSYLLLDIPGKFFERIIQARLNTFLSENNILKDKQHGIRPYEGAHTATTGTYKKIANALSEKKKKVDMVLRDAAEAFDKVWHNGLKYKLTRLHLPDILEKIM